MTSQRLGSRYLLEERIGEGGLGVVWRGRDISDGTVYAVKLLRAELAQDPDTLARFVRERNALVRFRHPNVVTLHDMIVEGDQLALVMDYVAGGDLAAHRRRRGGTLPPGEAVELTAQICSALAACHAAGIVHRDLKPANVLLDGDPERGAEVRLTDFGIARIGGEAPVTTAGTVLGTVYYMAPEAIAGAEPAPPCDAYAAGVTLYELLAGQPPFTGQAPAVIYGHLHTAPQRPDTVSAPLWRLISACLAKDPAARPTAAQLAQALRRPDVLTPGPAAAPVAAVLPPMEAGAPTGPAHLEAGPHTVTGIGWLTPAGPAGAPSDESTWPVPPALPPLPPRGRATARGSRRRLAWAGGGVAVLGVAGAAALALTGSPAAPVPAAASQAAALTASPTGSTAGPGAAGGKPASSGTASGAPTGTKAPSTVPASHSASAAATTASTAATSAAPSTAAATSAAPSSTAPSSTVPADTAWKCGPAAAARLYSTNAAVGQTMQACIRVFNGALELQGTLSPAVPSWDEQIKLVLKDTAQQDRGSYLSPVCTAADCVYTVSIVPPGRGSWTIIPQWERYNGSYESTGSEPGSVSY